MKNKLYIFILTLCGFMRTPDATETFDALIADGKTQSSYDGSLEVLGGRVQCKFPKINAKRFAKWRIKNPELVAKRATSDFILTYHDPDCFYTYSIFSKYIPENAREEAFILAGRFIEELKNMDTKNTDGFQAKISSLRRAEEDPRLRFRVGEVFFTIGTNLRYILDQHDIKPDRFNYFKITTEKSEKEEAEERAKGHNTELDDDPYLILEIDFYRKSPDKLKKAVTMSAIEFAEALAEMMGRP